MNKENLHLAEIPYDTGEVRYRYARYLSPSGDRWIRHGLFRAYYKCGALASEGHYENGYEEDVWRNYHENGALAAEGEYRHGQEVPGWRYWDNAGRESDAGQESKDLGSD